MELTEDQIFEKYAEQCRHCSRILLLPYEFEFICISCGLNLLKRKQEITKIQKKIILSID